MPLTTDELSPDEDLASTPMIGRWVRQGWIRRLPGTTGQGSRYLWPGWCRRMVALLRLPWEVSRGGVVHQPGHVVRMTGTADALAEWPDVPWLVWIEDQGRMAPAWTAADAVEIALAQPGPLRTIVSPPA